MLSEKQLQQLKKTHLVHFNECAKFFKEHQHLSIPLENDSLYRWISNLRSRYFKNPSDPKYLWLFEELTKLDSEWYINKRDFQYLDRCKDYFKLHGNLKISKQEKRISPWLEYMKDLYISGTASDIDKKIFQSLSSMDPDWFKYKISQFADYYFSNDQEAIDLCKKNVEDNGFISVNYSDKNLFEWFSQLRREYRRNPYNPERRSIFEKLFKIDPEWMLDVKYKMLYACKEHCLKYGNMEIIFDNPKLAIWLEKTRKEYFLYLKNPCETDTKYLYEALEKLDPNWMGNYLKVDKQSIEKDYSKVIKYTEDYEKF